MTPPAHTCGVSRIPSSPGPRRVLCEGGVGLVGGQPHEVAAGQRVALLGDAGGRGDVAARHTAGGGGMPPPPPWGSLTGLGPTLRGTSVPNGDRADAQLPGWASGTGVGQSGHLPGVTLGSNLTPTSRRGESRFDKWGEETDRKNRK